MMRAGHRHEESVEFEVGSWKSAVGAWNFTLETSLPVRKWAV
jgi:hypothetical protein